jgi:hypothetical protein
MSHALEQPTRVGTSPKASVVIVVPVFDDWVSFARLAEALDKVATGLPEWTLHVLAVDDGSEGDFRASALMDGRYPNLGSLQVAELVCNLGHQRAIAVGLTTALQNPAHEAVIVMDGDGEDDPEYVPALLAMHRSHPDCVITANRSERSEGLVFRVFYQIYKLFFRVLTGQRIAFGNYGLIPRRTAERLVYRPEIWNNLAAAIIRARVPKQSIWAKRAVRYHGKSKMNFVSLILHGFSAMSVYSDVLFVRLLLSTIAFGLLSTIGIIAVLAIRLGTDLAIPGWASTMVAALGLMLVQSIAVSLGGVFIVLQSRVTPTVIPNVVAPRYLESIHTVHSQ